jgi:hypothetical protein
VSAEEEEEEESAEEEEEVEGEEEEEDGEQGRHVRFASNIPSPVARRPVRSSLKNSTSADPTPTDRGTPAPKKSKTQQPDKNDGKGKSKASAEQIALWEREAEERAWGRVGGTSTIATLEEELLGAETRLEAAKAEAHIEGDDSLDEVGDESFQVVLHPRPARGTLLAQSLPGADDSMRRYRKRAELGPPVHDTPVPRKHTVKGPSALGRPQQAQFKPTRIETTVAPDSTARESSPPPVPGDSPLAEKSPQRSQPQPQPQPQPRFSNSPVRSQPLPPPPSLPPSPKPQTDPEPVVEATPVPQRRVVLSPETPSPPQSHSSLGRADLTRLRDVEITVISDSEDEEEQEKEREKSWARTEDVIEEPLPVFRKTTPRPKSPAAVVPSTTPTAVRSTTPKRAKSILAVSPASIPLPTTPEDKRKIRSLEAEVRRLREEVRRRSLFRRA